MLVFTLGLSARSACLISAQKLLPFKFYYSFYSFEKNSSSSSLNGMLGPAPIFETVRKATLQAKSRASYCDFPSRIATAYAPVKESPAPVVSTNFTPLCLYSSKL